MKALRIQSLGAVVVLAGLLSGCAGYGNATSPAQGDAVHELTARQTAYPDRVVEDGNPQLDGTIAENVIRTYRADTAERDAVRNTIQVNIGQ